MLAKAGQATLLAKVGQVTSLAEVGQATSLAEVGQAPLLAKVGQAPLLAKVGHVTLLAKVLCLLARLRRAGFGPPERLLSALETRGCAASLRALTADAGRTLQGPR